MANALYPKFKAKLMQSGNDATHALNSAEGATGVFAMLIDLADYTYSAAHEFYSDIAGASIVAEGEILTKTVGAATGTFDGANVTLTAVTGDGTEAVILYRKNAGANTTWPLIAFFDDTVSVVPNGGDININWSVSGIFTL